MAVNTIFGENVSLPSIPGIQSTCEKELLLLMKEVDLVAEKRSQGWQNQLFKLQKSLQEREKECENLRVSLQESKEENETLRRRVHHLEFKQDELTERYERQIAELREEVIKMRRNNPNLLQNKNGSVDQNKYEHLTKVADSFKEEVQHLKRQLQMKNDQHNLVESDQQRLMNMIKELQQNLNTKDKIIRHAQKNEKNLNSEIQALRHQIHKDLLPLTDLNLVDRHVKETAEAFLQEEAIYQEDLCNKITHEIYQLEEKLKSVADF